VIFVVRSQDVTRCNLVNALIFLKGDVIVERRAAIYTMSRIELIVLDAIRIKTITQKAFQVPGTLTFVEGLSPQGYAWKIMK